MFGSELCKDREYVLSEVKLAVLTWHGCELSIRGQPKSAYTANETPMVAYINTHAALQHIRQQAAAADTRGPVVLICGPADAGKTSLARLLLNYAVRAGSRPLLVDVDVGLNSLSIPGAVAASAVEQPIPFEQTDCLTVKAPLVFYYGHRDDGQQELFKQAVNALAAAVGKRFAASSVSRHAGCVINTAGWVEGAGFDLLLHIASAFHVSVVLTVGHERLHADLRAHPALASASVVKLARSGGVVSRSAAARSALRTRAVKDYFYGRDADLCPHQKVLGWREVSVWRLGGGAAAAPSHTLPIGATRLVDPNAVTRITVSLELLHSVMAVVYTAGMGGGAAAGGAGGATDAAGAAAASSAVTGNALLQRNVAGFVYVSAVDVQKKTLTLLAPAPGPLPSMTFLTGTIKWYD